MIDSIPPPINEFLTELETLDLRLQNDVWDLGNYFGVQPQYKSKIRILANSASKSILLMSHTQHERIVSKFEAIQSDYETLSNHLENYRKLYFERPDDLRISMEFIAILKHYFLNIHTENSKVNKYVDLPNFETAKNFLIENEFWNDLWFVISNRKFVISFFLNELKRQLTPVHQPVQPVHQPVQPVHQLTHTQISLLYFYKKEEINRDNVNDILNKHGQTSSEKLLRTYKTICKSINERIGSKYSKKNLQIVRILLTETEHLKRIDDEIGVLNTRKHKL